MLGILFGLSISKLFLLYLSKLFYMNLTEFYFPVKAMLLTIVSFMILFLITGPMSLKLLSKKSILELLVGTKSLKRDKIFKAIWNNWCNMSYIRICYDTIWQ